jgi:hypothetical protein
MQKVCALSIRLRHSAYRICQPAVLPPSIRPSFSMPSPPISSLSSVISTCLDRARDAFASIYTEGLSWQLTDLNALSHFFETAEAPSFAALELKQLQDLRQIYGRTSSEYVHAADQVRAFIKRAYDENEGLNIALLTFSPPLSVHERRSPDPQESQSPLPNHPPPQEPIGSISTCFTSVDACKDATKSCSGRGQCVEATKSGRTCFICTCGVTKTGKGSKVKTDIWVGQSCERKDISGFVYS